MTLPVAIKTAGSAMQAQLYAKKGASFNGSVTFGIYYNGVLLDTVTPTLTTSYQQITLTVDAGEVPYAETLQLVATVLGTTDSIYIDDLTRV